LRQWDIKGDKKQLIKFTWLYTCLMRLTKASLKLDSRVRSLEQGQIKDNGKVLLEEKFAVK